ncbi:putative qacE-like protein [Burkholderia cepacia]|nr:putative qacE-like protein [Burkholderia cepacia]
MTVTNTRFIVPGQTYAMSNVTSIKHYEKAPSRALGVIVAIIGVLILFAHAWLVGLIAIALGVFLAWNAKGQYDVLLHTSSGEVRAFQSPDRGLVQQIVSALNQAVVFRG